MTRPKKDVDMRRVVVDLSWPESFSVNAGIDGDSYLGKEYEIRLPTIDLMEKRILELGKGYFLYKTDLSRGYRQLRVDPLDWPLLGFTHEGKFYMDIWPPFGLRSAAMMMQRTSQAVAFIQFKLSHIVFAYIDDFGGGKKTESKASAALRALQGTLVELGLKEATKKICFPSQCMIWLGIIFNTLDMTMSIPVQKMKDIMLCLEDWHGRTHATRREIQSVIGMLQFVAKVAPSVRFLITECKIV